MVGQVSQRKSLWIGCYTNRFISYSQYWDRLINVYDDDDDDDLQIFEDGL